MLASKQSFGKVFKRPMYAIGTIVTKKTTLCTREILMVAVSMKLRKTSQDRKGSDLNKRYTLYEKC